MAKRSNFSPLPRVNVHIPAMPKQPKVGYRPKLTGMPKPPQIKLRHPVDFPQGPRMYRQTRGAQLSKTGPGLPPPGFVTSETTGSEWIWYWASMRVLDPERDPRQAPFWGGRQWQYQSQQLSQIVGVYAKSLSTNVDFIYMLNWPYIAMRIQTFRYHTAASSLKQAYDRAQAIREYGAFNLVDIYEQDFLGDASGAAAIILLKESLGLVRRLNPDTTGTTHVVANPYSALGVKL